MIQAIRRMFTDNQKSAPEKYVHESRLPADPDEMAATGAITLWRTDRDGRQWFRISPPDGLAWFASLSKSAGSAVKAVAPEQHIQASAEDDQIFWDDFNSRFDEKKAAADVGRWHDE